MSGFGVVSFVSGDLQLGVPSYGLRLVRRFGAESVGWFLVIAFSSLACLHLFGAGRAADMAGAALTTEGICAVSALLLLVGMGHLEALCSERQQGQLKVQDVSGKWTSRIETETSELRQQNRKLQERNTWCQQHLAAVQESETCYRSLFVESPQAMWVLDLRSHRILAVNKAAAQFYGLAREEFSAITAYDLLAESAAMEFAKYLAMPCSGAERPVRLSQRRKDRTLLEAELVGIDLCREGAPARLVLVSDIEPRKRDEAALRNVVRIEVIGQVAGGFAHHFNNLLAIIDANAALLQEDVADADSQQHLKQIAEAVSRAATLTRQLISVAGKRALRIAPMELNSLLVNMNYMIRRVVGKGVALQAAFGASVPPILADAFLVEQTVLNLILNARDAMPNGDAITLQTSTIMRRNPAVGNDGGAATGEFVRLTIRDTGCGMTPEVQAHLFEPFFSTKDVGRGTGLGLASVYGAVKQQAGWIEFSSEPGKGTEARVFFPCAPAFAKVDRSDSQFVSSLGTVLLVEADDRTRGMARCILNWNGYRVIEADSSTTALILWSQQAASVDLLLVDATLADGMSGRELASRLVQTKPTLKIVYAASSEAVRTDGPSVPDDHSKRLANP